MLYFVDLRYYVLYIYIFFTCYNNFLIKSIYSLQRKQFLLFKKEKENKKKMVKFLYKIPATNWHTTIA